LIRRRGGKNHRAASNRTKNLLAVLKAPFLVLAIRLVAVANGLSKAIEIAFIALLTVDDGGDDLFETGITKGRGVVIRAPRQGALLFPFLTTLDTFHTDCIHVLPGAMEENLFWGPLDSGPRWTLSNYHATTDKTKSNRSL
jgi:hypothetical protein